LSLQFDIPTQCDISVLELRTLTEAKPTRPFWYFELQCARNGEHKIRFVLEFNCLLVRKIGQSPSLADIANDESRVYRQVLDPVDADELHRAIGLAAHGVGIGAFVYLRRIFERLVSKRFNALKCDEGWTDADFACKRMEERIELLQKHLPSFLVRNKKVYAILSKGIHELEERECLAVFKMLKHVIYFILEDDRHKKEELELRREAEQTVAAFSGSAPRAAG
jgi:hypothetical protein